MPLCSNPYYCDAALQWACRTLPPQDWTHEYLGQLCDFEIEPFGNYEVTKGLKVGRFDEQIKRNKMLIYDFIQQSRSMPHRSIKYLLNSHYKVRYGLRAVANVFLMLIEDKRFLVQEVKNDTFLANNILKLGLLSSQHTKQDCDLFSQLYQDKMQKHLHENLGKLKVFWRAKVLAKRALYRANLVNADINNQKPEPAHKTQDGISIYVINGAILVENFYQNEVSILTPEDMNRLDKIVSGYSNACLYYATYHTMDVSHRQNLIEMVNKYVFSMMRLIKFGTWSEANRVSRCLDIVYNITLAEIGADVDDEPLRLQLKKFEKENVRQLLRTFEPSSLVHGLPLKHRLEILLLYKLLPSGDYGIFGATKRQEDLYHEYQNWLPNDLNLIKSEKDGPIAYYKWLMIFSFYKKHKVCPGIVKEDYIFLEESWIQKYPYCEPQEVDFRKTYMIDLNGEFLWRVRGRDYMDLIKDKAICPEEVDTLKDQASLRGLPQSRKSQLVNVLKTDELPNLEELTMDKVFLDVKADDKAEAKKERGRWFFEAGTWARLLISQLEDSIAPYASEVPGCMAGKSAADKLAYMNDLTVPLVGSDTLKRLLISFDIDKFSPGLPIEVHRSIDALWSEAFGIDKIRDYSRILTDGNIHYIKRGIHHILPKQGADFEGFFGRKLTMYHCAVMSYTVRLLREQKSTVGPAMFAALIDDGLLSVNIPRDRFADEVPKIKAVINKVYFQSGMRISWDKTFISSKLAIFLNDIRFLGRTIAPALKAVIKVTFKSGEEIRSLPQDLQYLEGTVRGAVTAGAMMCPLYGIYISHVIDCLNRWGLDSKTLASPFSLKAFLPYELGGLRLQNLVTLSGSITSENIEEQLGILEIIGYRIPQLKRTINHLINITLVNPTIQRSDECANVIIGACKKLKTDRLQQKLMNRMEAKLADSVIAGIFARTRGEEGGILRRMVGAGCELPVELRALILGSDIHVAYREIIRKFTSSRSMLSFVSRRELLSVAYVNLMEARAYFQANV